MPKGWKNNAYKSGSSVSVCLLCLLLFVLQILISPVSFSSERGISVFSKRDRIALLIGNANYEKTSLKNPINDALDLSETLKHFGFDVKSLVDADKQKMEESIRDFGYALTNNSVGLFFYAGHGLQVNGINYLVPIGSKIEKQTDIRYEAVDIGRVLAEMEHSKNRLNIIILDACRDNPFARGFRSIIKTGLARMDAPTGTYIAYATAPDTVAHDGNGRNGVFTKHLLKSIIIPGLPIEQIMKRVRIGVMHETRSKQVPWDSSSLTRDFFFVPSNMAESKLKPTLSSVDDFVYSDRNIDISPDDDSDIWDLPEIYPPTAPPQEETIAKDSIAVGKTTREACAKAATIIVRDFFKGHPSDDLFRESVYRMYCNVIKWLPDGQRRVEVSIEFYKKER